MKPNATLLATLLNIAAPKKAFIQVVAVPKNTTNLFGSIDEIAGTRLELLERNPEGDCLCLFTGKAGKNIVDVDHTDVES